MARIPGVPREKAGPMVKLVYIFMGRGMKKMTGRAPARGSGIEPVALANWILEDRLPARMQLQMHKHIWPPTARGV